jgi:hypothetical protein
LLSSGNNLTLMLLDGFGEVGSIGMEYGKLLLRHGHVSLDSGGQFSGNGDHNVCMVFISNGQPECHFC